MAARGSPRTTLILIVAVCIMTFLLSLRRSEGWGCGLSHPSSPIPHPLLHYGEVHHRRDGICLNRRVGFLIFARRVLIDSEPHHHRQTNVDDANSRALGLGPPFLPTPLPPNTSAMRCRCSHLTISPFKNRPNALSVSPTGIIAVSLTTWHDYSPTAFFGSVISKNLLVCSFFGSSILWYYNK